MSAEKEPKSGLSLPTLLISSLAAVAAAIVVPYFWERGSLIATAVTPIIVAIVSEALNRPAKAITAVAPRVTRRSATGAAVRSKQPTGVGARGEGPEQVSPWGTEDDPFGLRTPEPTRGRGFPWRLAILTGLLAAVIGAVVVTASELAVFGHSVGHSSRSTSVFGGHTSTATATPTATATESATETATEAPTEAATAQATGTATAAPSVTPAASPATTNETPTVAPTEATPVPTP